jgi:Tfp pilus assembly major pilin PilA
MKRKILPVLLALLLIICVFPVAAYALPEGVPSSLPAPVIANLELLKDDDGVPYFRFEATFPQSVLDLDIARPTDGWVNLETNGKYDNEEWGSTGGGGGHLDVFLENPVPGKPNTFYITADLEDEGGMTETVIKSRTYSYKLQFCYSYYDEDGNLGEVYSPWSNVLSSKSDSYYKGASDWARDELDKAAAYGLITERIRGDMSAKITREEFAEIAVKLYEKYTGQTATAGTASFTDTTNPEILKAANLGLVTGVGSGKFDPGALVTREQMATILLRALKVINPSADYATNDAAKFADDNKIDAWARDGVYYCSGKDIVKGVGSNLFDPDGPATREAAVIVCTRAYELFK